MRTIKCFDCDFNWTALDEPLQSNPPSAAHDWAGVDPQAYYDWHMAFGNNVIFCQAYAFSGYAFYPSKLGPLAAGTGSRFFPRLYEIARRNDTPVWSYFCVGSDGFMGNSRPEWVVPRSRNELPWGALAPESPWTDLLCARIREFLTDYPVDWLLFDWFIYGSLHPDTARVQPAWFAARPFKEIVGRDLPERAEEITEEEHLSYKREILTRQFRRIKEAVTDTSPNTKIVFNVPYWQPREALWEGHAMMTESDMLFAESSDESIVEWLLDVRQPGQRVMTTIIGRQDGGSEVCDPTSWQRWHERGCDFFGYAWGTPPDFRPHPRYRHELEIVKRAFEEIG